MNEKAVSSVWCVVANIVESRPYGPGGVEERRGTKHFSPGTKVYIRNVYWGTGGEHAEVIGRHRGGSQMVAMVIRSDCMTNLRVKMVYEPRVIERLVALPGSAGTTERGDAFKPWDGGLVSKARADRIAEEFGGRVSAVVSPFGYLSSLWRTALGRRGG